MDGGTTVHKAVQWVFFELSGYCAAMFHLYFTKSTVVPTKSDSDVILCLQLLSKNNSYTLLDLTLIYRSLVYKSYPEDRIDTQVNYRL